MDREHHFKIEEAKKYGIEKAVLLYNIRFWLDKNRANKKNIFEKDGIEYFWTFNSASSYGELFPYMSERSISRYLMELENEDGVLISGNFNKIAYDRTKWFTLDDYKIDQSISQNDQSMSQNGRPIPDTNTDNKTDKEVKTKSSTEILIDSVYKLWIDMACAALDLTKKEVEKSKLLYVVSTACSREDFTLDDYRSLFEHFFADDGMKHENKISYSLCLSSAYIAKYKLAKKGKPKSKSTASLSSEMRL